MDRHTLVLLGERISFPCLNDFYAVAKRVSGEHSKYLYEGCQLEGAYSLTSHCRNQPMTSETDSFRDVFDRFSSALNPELIEYNSFLDIPLWGHHHG